MALPQGFVLDAPVEQPKLPAGFVLDSAPSAVPLRNETIGQAQPPSLMQRLSPDSLVQEHRFGSIPYAIGRGLQEFAPMVNRLVAPPSQAEGMKPGIGKALIEQATLPNALLAGTGEPIVAAALQSTLGKIGLATVLSLFAKQGAEQAGTSFGAASAEPAGGQRRYDLTQGAIGTAMALPVVAPALAKAPEAPTSGLSASDVSGNVYAGLLKQPSRFVADEHGTVSDQYPPAKPQTFSADDLQAAMSKNQIVPKADMSQDPAILQAIKDAGFDLSSRSPTKEPLVASPVVEATKKSGVISPQAELPLQEKPTATTLQPPEGDKLVTVEKPDGSTYQAAFGGKYYNHPKRGEVASIARVNEQGQWTHGMLGQGEKIVEPTQDAVKGLKYVSKDGNEELLVTPSSKQQGDWQVSGFGKDADGRVIPKGDSTFKTQQEAIDSVPLDMFDKKTEVKQSDVAHSIIGEQPLYSSGVNPEHFDWAGRQFVTQAEKYLRDPKVIGFAQGASVDAGQLKNRLRNKLGENSTEWKMLQDAGIDKVEGKKTSAEMAEWVKENSPKVEVRKFGAFKDIKTPAIDEQNKLQHEIETAGFRVSDYGKLTKSGSDLEWDWNNPNVPRDVVTKAKRYAELTVETEKEKSKVSSERSHWQSIAPKSEQDMPGYVEIAVVKPPKRLSVSEYDKKRQAKEIGFDPHNTTWRTDYTKFPGDLVEHEQFPSSHNFPPNTLGFVRGYMETLPNGKKVFHVIELQSDWAQKYRDQITKEKEETTREGGRGYPADTFTTPTQRAAKLQDPLLPHYERLALKAAIDHARSEGADAIAISDAETAMMTEGHDRLGGEHGQRGIYPTDENIRAAQKIPKDDPTHVGSIAQDILRGKSHQVTGIDKDYEKVLKNKYGFEVTSGEPIQNAGMHLHYDRTLPKIAEELTGQKGERVGFGEHKMAFGSRQEVEDAFGVGMPEMTGEKEPRKDLIFRNSNNTPKTDVTARMYPIDKPAARLASGEPMSATGKLYGGIPFLDPDFIAKTAKDLGDAAGKVGDKLKNVANAQQLKTTMAAMKDATSGLATKHANEGASSITGQLERDTGRKDKRNSLDRQALLFVRESRETPATLQAWKQQLLKAPTSKERAQALLALNHAITDFDKLAPTSKIYDSLMEKEVKLEEQSGRAIERLKDVGYVMHLAEDAGDKTSFTHARDTEMQTMVDRISKGVPMGSLDAVELLRSRIARGQQIYVQAKVFRDNLERLKTSDGQQVVKPLEKVSRGEGRKEDVRVPSGYRKVSIGQEDIAVHEGYADTVQALVDPSIFLKNSIGRTIMKTRGFSKSIALAGDSFHVVRVGAYGVGAKLGTGNLPVLKFKTGVTVLDNSIGELMKKAESGQINKADLANLVEWKRRLDMGIKSGFNVSRVVDAFNQQWIEKIPGLKQTQHWIFQTWQRGVMADVYNKTWEVYRKQNPQMTEMQVSRKVSADLNELFGTLGRQSWLAKSRSFQDMWQLIALAPQWTEGRTRTELHAYTGTAQGVGRMLQGKAPNFNIQSRVVGSIILMYLAANQVINMATRKQATFDNKENDHKLDAFIPDKMGGSEGYWLSPIANAEEVTHSLINSYQKQGGNVWEAWLDFAGGHESTLAKPALTGMTGRAYGLTGPSVPRFTGMAENAVPVPIGTPALKEMATGKTSQQTEKQVLSRVGLKVDNAQSARQQIYQKVRQWKKVNNIPEETGLFQQSKYLGLTAALRKNDMAEAQKEYRSLQEPDGKDTTEQKVKLIKEYFKDYATKSFTGRKDLEEKFAATLSAEDKALYEKAKADNHSVEQNFYDMIGEAVPDGKHKVGKHNLIFN